LKDAKATLALLEARDKNLLRRLSPKDYSEFIEVLYDDFLIVLQDFESAAMSTQLSSDEDTLTSLLCMNLRRFSYYEIPTNFRDDLGRLVIVVKHLTANHSWFAFAKMCLSTAEMGEDFPHLSSNLSVPWPNNCIGLLAYTRPSNAAKLMRDWREELNRPNSPNASLEECERRPQLHFYSTCKHQVSGQPIRVWHMCLALQQLDKHKTIMTAKEVKRTHVVMLVHGIRTQAEWQERAASILESDPTIRVVPTRFGYLDVFRFLVPIAAVRKKPVTRITRLIRDELSRKPAHLSIVAHSFGTYIISQILEEESDIDIHRLILCGSIIPEGFDWARHRNRIGPRDASDWQIVNDCGMKDIWPVFAQSITWGYGASGRFGFGHGRVRDRFHSLGHSDFFSSDFVRKFWLPFLSEGHVAQGVLDRATTPLWVSLLTVTKLKYIFVPILLALVLSFCYWIFQSSKKFFFPDASSASLSTYATPRANAISPGKSIVKGEPIYKAERKK
jgi:hypothetical protein